MIQSEKYLWYDIEIYYDTYPSDPRDYSKLWTMLCNHRIYDLWDEKLPEYWESFWDNFMMYIDVQYNITNKDPEDMTEKDYEKIDKFISNEIIYYPLYLYDHSGISMSIWDYKDKIDSWQVGYIYCSKDDIRSWNNIKTVRKHHVDDAKRLLEKEVETYDKYLIWEIYEYRIPLLWEYSSWYETVEETISEAKLMIDTIDKWWHILEDSDRIYRKCLDIFWYNFHKLKWELYFNEDWKQCWDKEDLLINLVWKKLK